MIFPFSYNGTNHTLELSFVAGTTESAPFLFGGELPVVIPDFYIAKCQTTQALWKYMMGDEQNHLMVVLALD